MTVKLTLKLSGAVLAAGILFGVGLRVSQWLVPAPAVRVSLCDGADSCLVPEGELALPVDLPPQEQALQLEHGAPPAPVYPVSESI